LSSCGLVEPPYSTDCAAAIKEAELRRTSGASDARVPPNLMGTCIRVGRRALLHDVLATTTRARAMKYFDAVCTHQLNYAMRTAI
jgi:hypothetical protein